jgi:hypothetical protein
MKGAGRAVELWPAAPKARNAAHSQERQHSAVEGGTRDRVRPAGAHHVRRLRCPASGIPRGGDAVNVRLAIESGVAAPARSA